MVRPRRLELPLPLKNSDLNAARLPIPPRPHTMFLIFIPCQYFLKEKFFVSQLKALVEISLQGNFRKIRGYKYLWKQNNELLSSKAHAFIEAIILGKN